MGIVFNAAQKIKSLKPQTLFGFRDYNLVLIVSDVWMLIRRNKHELIIKPIAGAMAN